MGSHMNYLHHRPLLTFFLPKGKPKRYFRCTRDFGFYNLVLLWLVCVCPPPVAHTAHIARSRRDAPSWSTSRWCGHLV